MNTNVITTIKLQVEELATKDDALRKVLNEESSILRIDTNHEKQLARVVFNDSAQNFKALQQKLESHGFKITVISATEQPVSAEEAKPEEEVSTTTFSVEGISCASCEVRIERTLQKLQGVTLVDVDAKRALAKVTAVGDPKKQLHDFNRVLADLGYHLKPYSPQERKEAKASSLPLLDKEKPKFWELVMLFILVWTVGALLNRLGVLKQSFGISEGTGFTAAAVLGLVAGTSQCLAVVSGLLLGIAAKFREKHGTVRGLRLAQPIILFSAGRVASYAVFGGLTGIVGQALSPSPLVTGLITILAALLMIAIGLNILNIQPRLLLKLQMRAPKGLMRKIHDLSENSASSWTPAVLGAATFFIPCGFTQSLQIYALGAGSFKAGALALTGFALGTIPAIFALWYASSVFRGKAGKMFFKFAGAAVLLLGIWNVQNGLTIVGRPLRLPKFFEARQASALDKAVDQNVIFDGQKQIVKMKVDYGGYDLREFTVRAGVPVRWEISGDFGGCLTILQSPKLGIREKLQPNQVNIVEFTPEEIGDATFSCSMGMFRGVIHVIPNT